MNSHRGRLSKPRFLACMALSCVSLQVTAQDISTPLTQRSLEAIYDSLRNPVIDNQRGVTVRNVSVERGGQRVLFREGIVHFFKPVCGRTPGAVFRGSGSLAVRPSTDVEAVEFQRRSGKRLARGEYSYNFERCVLWFADTTLQSLEPSQRDIPVELIEEKAVRRSVEYITYPSRPNSLYSLVRELSERSPASVLLAHVILDYEGTDIFLDVDTRRSEEVVISQPSAGFSSGWDFVRKSLCSFHMPGEYQGRGGFQLPHDDRHRLKLLGTSVSLDCGRRRRLVGTATLRLQPVETCPRTSIFILDPVLRIRSITDGHGNAVPFLRESSWETLVYLGAEDSAEFSLTFRYEGDFFQPRTLFLMSSASGWYPGLNYLQRGTFDMTFSLPDDIQFTCAGTKLLDTLQDGKRTVRFRILEPSLAASFTMGDFKISKVQLSDSEPQVKVYSLTGDNAERIGAEISYGVHFFSYFIGEYPFRELRITPGPLLNAQAFPNLIHLPAAERTVGKGDEFVFLDRIHEVSHAYWGLGVGWKSYHDEWLSEGLADYSALLYSLFYLKRDQVFFEKLLQWKENILGVRQYALGSGAPAGSIWLGYRSVDYGLLSYRKAAWVFHMLRMLVMDYQTLNDERFRDILRDFYSSYHGREASTSDFQSIVEKHTGTDMGWFFKEWIYYSAIPTYTLQKSVGRTEAGKWLLTLKLTQTGVPDTFRMPVPVKIQLKNGSVLYGRLLMDRPVKTFSYELADEPQEVQLNPFEAVLCRITE